MMDLRLLVMDVVGRAPRWLWVLLGVLTMLALTWVNGRPESAGLIPAPWDKLAHSAVFGTLGMLFALGFGKEHRWLALVLVVGFGAFDELRQLHLPGRTASWADFSVDVMAVAGRFCLLVGCVGKRGLVRHAGEGCVAGFAISRR